MGNININGKTAVHAKSDGQLITTDVCLTPPFCVPIPYTNQAESKMADMTASSVKVEGNPACNSKSNFKISQGDAPGACAGVASGSIGQMAEFITFSNDVMIEGKPAVRNGDKMVSNMKNTGPQPLQQPPAGDASAGTAKAPAKIEGEFSQQFDFSNLIGFAPGETAVLERLNYEITDKENTISITGTLNKQGLTERIYTPGKTDLIVWLGDGNWKVFSEYDHSGHENEETAKDAATLRFGFVNFARATIPELDYKFTVNGKEYTGKTDETGCAQSLDGISPGSTVDISVLCEKNQTYKKIAAVTADAGETHHTIVSPKIKIESVTEQHTGEAAAPKAKTNAPAKKKSASKPVPQKTATETNRDKNGNPLATLLENNLTMLLVKGFLKSYLYWTSAAFSKASATTQGSPKINPANHPSMAKEGTPLSKSNLDILQALVKFAEKQVLFDYRGCGAKDKDGVFVRSTQAVIDKYTDTLIGNPDFNYTDAKGDHDGSKNATDFAGLCLAYVKVALHQSGYVNGLPGKTLAKETVNEWENWDYEDVSKDLPQVKITYERAYAENDVPKAEKALKKEARVKELNAQLKKLHTKLDTAKKAKDAKKTEALQKEIDAKNGELEMATKEAEKANKDKPDKTKAEYTQPDLMYTLPGDLIVYEQVDPVEINAAGHIDIRTYHGFFSDAVWRLTPTLGRQPPTTKRYRVVGVYRKISDTMAMVRVQAFLRILRELEAKGYSEPYRALPREHGKEVLFDGFDTHPSNEEDDTPAGAYQIKWSAWDEVTKLTGWPKTFTPEMQERIAIFRLQQRPMEREFKYPRHTALGYIMEGKIEQAINESKLWYEWACLPGAADKSQAQITMDEIKKRYEEYSGEDAK